MVPEDTNLLVLTISAFWSSSRWPLATYMSFKRHRSIPLGGRYRQVSLYYFQFVMTIMSAAINKCYRYGSIILSTSAFSFDRSIEIWRARSYAGPIMHSTRISMITVSNNRVSLVSPSPWAETSHIAAAVIGTRVLCYLTATDHRYVMIGTIKFVDNSVNVNSAHKLDHCDVIASCSEVGCAAQLNSKVSLSHSQQLTWIEQLEAQASKPAGQSMPPIFSTIHAIAFI